MPGVDQPVILPGEVPVTFWQQVDAVNSAVTATNLGRLLRRLHSLPTPPFYLPRFRPLDRLKMMATASNWLALADQRWLMERAGILQQQLENTEFRLGPPGLVHGDAQLDNVIPALPDPVLADWDGTAIAPREWDLVPTAAERRFGGSAQLLEDLLDAYGADPTGDSGWAVLVDIYELRSVAAHIRRAPVSPPHAREATLRIASLRAGDRTVRWSAVG
jgi:aminoglycoside phosphotransferase (APT) family kinase protein